MSGVTITLGMNLKPEAVDGFCNALPEMIKDTAKRPGFQAIRIVRHKDDPNRVLFVETWESEQAYNDYITWRTERGDMDGFAQILQEPPKMDVWPAVVAAG